MNITPHGPPQIWRNDKGELHRLGGPAIIWPDGCEYWFKRGDSHRLDGPAIIRLDGSQEYWVDGKIPTAIMNIIITDKKMIFDGELIPEVEYLYLDSFQQAYRFDDVDEFALAVLYYS